MKFYEDFMNRNGEDMKYEKHEWKHHVYVDGELKEVLDIMPSIKLMQEKYHARFLYNSWMKTEPVILYKFRRDKDKE